MAITSALKLPADALILEYDTTDGSVLMNFNFTIGVNQPISVDINLQEMLQAAGLMDDTIDFFKSLVDTDASINANAGVSFGLNLKLGIASANNQSYPFISGMFVFLISYGRGIITRGTTTSASVYLIYIKSALWVLMLVEVIQYIYVGFIKCCR